MKHTKLLPLMIFALVAPATLPAAPVARYTAKRCTQTITLDGILGEAAWLNADSAVFVKSIDWSAPARGSSVRFLWDTANLYVAISSKDSDLWGTITARDGSVYNEEAVEFFFDPDGDGLNYTEIDFNCRGTVVDALLSKAFSQGGSANLGWNAANMRFAVKARGTIGTQSDTDTGLVLEAAFAWRDFTGISTVALPPHAGDTLRCNTYRIEGRTDPKEWSCWSSVESNAPGCFHMPERFGKLVFSDQPAVPVATTNREKTGPVKCAGASCITARMTLRGLEMRTTTGWYRSDGRRVVSSSRSVP